MPSWTLLIAVILLYGFWAVAMRVIGQHVSLPWAALVGLIVSIPVDVILISRINGPTPAPRYIIWCVLMTLASILAGFLYIKAGKVFSGPVLTSTTALYPLAALPVFIAMGEKPTWRQGLGVLLCSLGAWLIS